MIQKFGKLSYFLDGSTDLVDAFTENLIEKLIGFDIDCEIESDTCSNEAISIQKKIKGIYQEVYFRE